MGDTEQIAAHVDKESDLLAAFNEYRDEGMSKSETVRRLCRIALEHEGYMHRPADHEPPRSPREWWREDAKQRSTEFAVLGAVAATLANGNIVALAVSALLVSVAVLGLYYRYDDYRAAQTPASGETASTAMTDGGRGGE